MSPRYPLSNPPYALINKSWDLQRLLRQEPAGRGQRPQQSWLTCLLSEPRGHWTASGDGVCAASCAISSACQTPPAGWCCQATRGEETGCLHPSAVASGKEMPVGPAQKAGQEAGLSLRVFPRLGLSLLSWNCKTQCLNMSKGGRVPKQRWKQKTALLSGCPWLLRRCTRLLP